MKLFAPAILLFCSLCAAQPAEDSAVNRARLDLDRMQELVKSGVVSRARVDQAKDALADAQDEATIRASLYQTDISVEKADQLVDLTAKRLERHQQVVDQRNDFLQRGILAKSEVADSIAALDQAKREHDWAVTRARLSRELLEAVKNEQEAMRQMEAMAAGARASANVEHFSGNGKFNLTEFPRIEKDFEYRFAHPLPVSAMGETGVHKALGFDHRNRVDIALQPDLPEGEWLRHYLALRNIPYFAFRSAVAHKATGAHIHIGPASTHYLTQAGIPARVGSSGRVNHTAAGED